jgi:Xaa-Pro aminopeptidase
MPIRETMPLSAYRERRETLVQHISQTLSPAKGMLVLFGNFEHDCRPFRQESSFYYLTGIVEPAVALTIDLATKESTLYIPHLPTRAQWVETALSIDVEPAVYGVDALAYLGEPIEHYAPTPFFSRFHYSALIDALRKALTEKQAIITFCPTDSNRYIEQRFIVERLKSMLPELSESVVDCSEVVARMRRTKSKAELELLYKAIAITSEGQMALAQRIEPEIYEYELQALIEYIITAMGGRIAFPTIVGSGLNSTILHYQSNNRLLKKNDLVVVDVGAEYGYYCADLTRTFPVSGVFSARQRELYKLVLEAQNYIASIARPGYWLSNKEHPDQSLHHLAFQYFKKAGYENYFTHGIGHYLGLDVHDVGSYSEPLQQGDVITIEPGIYIPDEGIGIRIEDNYWITQDDAVCLSEELPKELEVIENMMHENHDED